MKTLANHCFGCGSENSIGLHLSFEISASPSGTLTSKADVCLDCRYEGGTGYLHGGILATLMDEAMSKLNRPLGVKAMTRCLEVEYIRPSPISVPLRLTASHIRRQGRKLFHAAELRDTEGKLLVKSTGLFIEIPNEPL